MKKELEEALADQMYFIRPKPFELKAVDAITWAAHFEKEENRQILLTTHKDAAGHLVHVSTIFLGMRSGSDELGRPLLFETTITFDYDGSTLLGYPKRYHSEVDAIEGHKRAEREAAGAMRKEKSEMVTGKDAKVFIDGKEVKMSDVSFNLETGLQIKPTATVATPEETEAKKQFNEALKNL